MIAWAEHTEGRHVCKGVHVSVWVPQTERQPIVQKLWWTTPAFEDSASGRSMQQPWLVLSGTQHICSIPDGRECRKCLHIHYGPELSPAFRDAQPPGGIFIRKRRDAHERVHARTHETRECIPSTLLLSLPGLHAALSLSSGSRFSPGAPDKKRMFVWPEHTSGLCLLDAGENWSGWQDRSPMAYFHQSKREQDHSHCLLWPGPLLSGIRKPIWRRPCC